MSSSSQKIVQKLWRYCNVLRDDGLSYPDYVEQLTYLLFLKMAHEQTLLDPTVPSPVPRGADWPSLISKRGRELHLHYAKVLKALSTGEGILGLIFRRAESRISDPEKLELLVVDLIDRESWTSLDADVKGDAYEGLLDKNAQDTKSGAGQYFTPRPLVQSIVEVLKPQPGERISDPACGTCGFLLAAYHYIRANNPNLTAEQQKHLRLHAFRGVELVDAVARLGAMNLLLHGIGPIGADGDLPILTRDSLNAPPEQRFDLVLTNPPFGKKSSIAIVRGDDEHERRMRTVVRKDFWAPSSNKQLNFVQHVVSMLDEGGRAAVVVPDNVLSEGGAGEAVRRRLLAECDVHTLLRLPTGIFYAPGVKANVLFFDRRRPAAGGSGRKLWVYDLRTAMNFRLKTNPLRRSDLDEFVHCYSADARTGRKETWSSANVQGRWRAFTHDEIRGRGKCSLDLTWVRDDGAEKPNASRPRHLLSAMLKDLKSAVEQLEGIADGLAKKS